MDSDKVDEQNKKETVAMAERYCFTKQRFRLGIILGMVFSLPHIALLALVLLAGTEADQQ